MIYHVYLILMSCPGVHHAAEYNATSLGATRATNSRSRAPGPLRFRLDADMMASVDDYNII